MLACVHARSADRRRDLLHKLSTRLVHENHVVVIENLMVHNLPKTRRLARAKSAWSGSRGMLQHKPAWCSRDAIAVDRWFPSSAFCSHCRAAQQWRPRCIGTWTCTCGATHGRDIDAARNILAAGLTVSAGGAGVRPQRSTPGRQSATKQETPRREP